jgi:hypothetical protein
VHRWIADNYGKPLSVYRLKTPLKLVLKIRGYGFYEEIWAMQETNLTKYQKAFRVFTSANRRRALVSPSDSKLQQVKSTKSIVGIVTPKKSIGSFDSIRK